MPRCLGLVGELGSGREFIVDLIGVLGVIGDCGIDQGLGDPREFCSPVPAVIGRNVTIDDGADHVRNLGSPNQDRPMAPCALSAT